MEAKNVIDAHAEQASEPEPAVVAEFVDGLNRTWRPELSTPVLIRACRILHIKIRDIFALDIEVAALMDLVWYTCEKQAKARKISYDDFMESIPLDVIPNAIDAMLRTALNAFPQGGGSDTSDPQIAGSGMLSMLFNSLRNQV